MAMKGDFVNFTGGEDNFDMIVSAFPVSTFYSLCAILMCFFSLEMLLKTFPHISHFFALATFLASFSSSV